MGVCRAVVDLAAVLDTHVVVVGPLTLDCRERVLSCLGVALVVVVVATPGCGCMEEREGAVDDGTHASCGVASGGCGRVGRRTRGQRSDGCAGLTRGMGGDFGSCVGVGWCRQLGNGRGGVGAWKGGEHCTGVFGSGAGAPLGVVGFGGGGGG